MSDFNIKLKSSKKYFDTKTNQLAFYDEDQNKSNQEKINLFFNLINGKINNIYGLRIINPENDFDETFTSEMRKCNNSNKFNLVKNYICDYIFGKEQKLKIELVQQLQGSIMAYPIQATIGEIIGSENSTKCFNIVGLGQKIEISGQKLKGHMKYLTIHFKLEISSKQPISEIQKEEYFKNEKYKIYFKIQKKDILIFESETFTDDGKFNIVQIPLNILSSNFSVLFFNDKNQNIGTINTNYNKITHPQTINKIFFITRLSLMDNLCIYNCSSIRDEITFLDYVKNIRIALDIGIDFTGSNGNPDDVGTLHCRLPNAEKRNPYERAIISCATVMADYDYDQLFPVYGFGAIVKNEIEKGTQMCFNINFKEDPNIQFVDNIMKEYYSCLDEIVFAGPTNFAPIINKIIENIKKENDNKEYHVLMMLTDGIIDDLEDTIDTLVEGSYLPLSVIIIGIGDANFTKMVKLDADDDPLISRNGKKRQRDLVQFVPFNKFEKDEKKLAEEIIEEIPRQVIEYYTLNDLYPEQLSTKEKNDNNNNNNLNENYVEPNYSTNIFQNASYNLFNNNSFGSYVDQASSYNK